MTRPAGPDLVDDLGLALALADEADELTLPRFVARDVAAAWKDDRTEVTDIDRGAERAIVDRLVAERPDHGAFGEEHGSRGDESSPWRWVVDPIDGTSGYVRGIPIWATLIALTHVEHGAVLGVVSAPALGHRWWGAIGLGAHVSTPHGTRDISVSTVASVEEAQVSVILGAGWERLGLTERLVALQQRARRARGLGDFWQHVLVAEGALDVAVDAVGVAEHDIAAVQAIVEAAGGRLTDRDGVPTYRHDTAISSNGLLHDEVLALLRR